MKFSYLSICPLLAILPSASFGVLVGTWTSSQNPADLGDAGASSVLLTANPTVNDTSGDPVEYTSSVSGGGSDYTDVVTLSSTQQTQLSGAGLAVTQGLDNVRGATRKLTGSSFQFFGGGNSADSTIDFFISPDNLSDVSQLIFETGGSGAGSSLNMLGTTLTLASAQTAANAVKTTVDLGVVYDAIPNTDDMLHVRMGFDLTNSEIILSVANLATGLSTQSSIAYTGTIWTGNDAMGIFNFQGTVGGSNGGNVPTGYSNFDGQLAGFRLYSNEVLAPIPEPSSMALLCLSLLGLSRRRR